MSPENRLHELKIQLPKLAEPRGNYLPWVRSGNLLFLSGALCLTNATMTHTGPVGEDQTVETAYQGARVCALNLLSVIKAAMGSLDRVERIVSLTGFVNAIAGFSESPQVINGASDFLVSIFGDKGCHARAAVAVNGLPKNSTVEVQAVVEISDE